MTRNAILRSAAVGLLLCDAEADRRSAEQMVTTVVTAEEPQTFLKNYGGDPWIAPPEEAQARLVPTSRPGATSASPSSSRSDIAPRNISTNARQILQRWHAKLVSLVDLLA